MTLRFRELPNGDSEASDRKTKYDHRQARAHPGKKRALIRQVIASPRRIIRLCHFFNYSVTSQRFYVQQLGENPSRPKKVDIRERLLSLLLDLSGNTRPL
jgi:hypothetical protein